ncbi:MAG: hypothetical protein QOH21_920 [Acidobacteriota bacterium]|jgi:hypothetical protein|nr:hypothetical protein [Acidobacteriota bacterium]
MTTSLRILLDGLIDYAGLFPPAALSMQDAVRNYARYREGDYAWALGRFVVQAERLREMPRTFPLSVLASAANLPEREPVLEVKAATLAEVEEIAGQANGRTVFVELTDLTLLPALRDHGLRAKIRTGGITADAFPTAETIAAFLRACKAAGVAFKATAGLHHPLRCVKPLTYEPNAAMGLMHGFVNVFLAAALLDHAEAVIKEEDAAAFTFDDEGVRWRDHRVSNDALRALRRDFAISFGSCSFEEPIADLQALGWL